MMTKQISIPVTHVAKVGRDELRSVFGDLDEANIIKILGLNPSLADLEEAAVWAVGDGDVLARSGHPLGVLTSDIVEILTADEDEPPPVR
jgi:hypothetical protein